MSDLNGGRRAPRVGESKALACCSASHSIAVQVAEPKWLEMCATCLVDARMRSYALPIESYGSRVSEASGLR
jgi:hypothetical protein